MLTNRPVYSGHILSSLQKQFKPDYHLYETELALSEWVLPTLWYSLFDAILCLVRFGMAHVKLQAPKVLPSYECKQLSLAVQHWNLFILEWRGNQIKSHFKDPTIFQTYAVVVTMHNFNKSKKNTLLWFNLQRLVKITGFKAPSDFLGTIAKFCHIFGVEIEARIEQAVLSDILIVGAHCQRRNV